MIRVTALNKQWLRWLLPVAAVITFSLITALSTRGPLDAEDDPGYIEWRQVDIVVGGDAGSLRAEADIVLPASIRAGVDSGVGLQFIVRLRIVEPRRFWIDKLEATDTQRYNLHYYELTRHYRVESVDGSRGRNYRSLSAALDGLGAFEKRDLPDTIVAALNRPGIQARLDMRLDTRSLPLPLQSLFTSSWRLYSEEYLWSVN